MRQEIIDSAASYGVGGTALIIANLADLANIAQAITVILACLVVGVRLAHDSIKLYRYWRGK